ncbi:MAG: ribonuclease HII [Candidatus Aenigmatarchaeota archaeon]
MSKTVLGIDEAGRGAVVGDMIICGLLVEENDLDKLSEIGVKDSKDLSSYKRNKLFSKIKDIAKDFVIIEVTAKDIDREREERSLNRIESIRMAEIIDVLEPDKVVVDSTEVNTEKIEAELRSRLKDSLKDEVEMVVENYADETYPVVSGASILAKVTRDESIKTLEGRLNKTIGKGYPSDTRTIKFLKEILRENGKFPDYVRKSWSTASRIKAEIEQKNLGDY